MTTTLDVFISSKMVELKTERDALYALLPTLDYGDIKLRAWVFEEDAPASSDSIRKIYLKALQNSALYLGLFWNRYGEWTIDEFDCAAEWGMERHIYVKDVDAAQRDPKLTAFLNQHGDVPTGITAKWFKTPDELCDAVKHTLDGWVAKYRSGPSGESSARLYKSPDAIIERPEILIGRDNDLVRVKTFLGQNGRILIQGFSGTGKTALAAEAAAQFITERPGHILWLRIGSNDANSIFEALASVFDARTEMAKQAGDSNKAHLLRSKLIESEIRLVVLDDAWNGQALPPLTDAIPPNMPLLISSRRHYGLNQSVPIGDLAPDAGLKLLGYHVKADFNEDTPAQELCAALSNLPFALRIAGISLKMRNQSPAELLSEIENAPHDLTLPLDFSEKGRENVAKLLQVSLNALDEQSRAVFLAFGAFFAPQLTAEMLSTYKARSVERELFILRDHGLVELVQATKTSVEYYHLHDLAYSYTKTQATYEEHNRAILSCFAYLESRNKPSPLNFAFLTPEIDNFLGASKWAFEDCNYTVVERFALSLFAENQILDFQGYSAEAISLLQLALIAVEQLGSVQGRITQLGNLGNAYADIGEYKLAIQCYSEVLNMSQRIKERGIEGHALSNIGNIYYHLGKHLDAIDYYNRALNLYRELKNVRAIAMVISNLGNAYRTLGEHLKAIPFFEESIQLSRKVKDKRSETNAIGNLGIAYANLKEYEKAREYLEIALELSYQIGDKNSEGSCLSNLGSVYHALKNYERSIELYEQALVLSRQTGDKQGEANRLANIGLLYYDSEEYEKAEHYFQNALNLFLKMGDSAGEIKTWLNLALTFEKLNQFTKSLDCYEQLREIFTSLGDSSLIQWALERISEIKRKIDLVDDDIS